MVVSDLTGDRKLNCLRLATATLFIYLFWARSFTSISISVVSRQIARAVRRFGYNGCHRASRTGTERCAATVSSTGAPAANRPTRSFSIIPKRRPMRLENWLPDDAITSAFKRKWRATRECIFFHLWINTSSDCCSINIWWVACLLDWPGSYVHMDETYVSTRLSDWFNDWLIDWLLALCSIDSLLSVNFFSSVVI